MTARAFSSVCHCGAVRAEARLPSGDVHACHCGACRRWSGGPEFGVDAGNVIWTGEQAIGVYGSSDRAERGFCSLCGTHLRYRTMAAGDWSVNRFLASETSGLSLTGEVFVDEQPGFYSFAQTTTRQTGAKFAAEYNRRAEQSRGGSMK